MKFKEYRGSHLHLSYPSFLRVRSGEPTWTAFGPQSSSILIDVDPEPVAARAFSEGIRSEVDTPGFEITTIREGNFSSPNGITGFETVRRTINGIGHAHWNWNIDGRTITDRIINIRVSVGEEYWDNATIWQELINSIRIIGNVSHESDKRQRYMRFQQTQVRRETKKPNLPGFPEDLGYLLNIAIELSLFSEKDLEDNPKALAVVEEGLKKEMHSMNPQEARVRLRRDRECLGKWIESQNVEALPEAAGLHALCGMLLYARNIY